MMLTTEWGEQGLAAHRESAAIVIIDVLSFSTAVDIAVGRGAAVHPFPHGDPIAAAAEARRLGARLAHPRTAAGGQLSLSPASLTALSPGDRLLLPSPNGARLSHAAGLDPARPAIFAGSLRNARAVATAAARAANGGPIALIPAGERWPDGSLRPAIEDWLGAGALAHHLPLPMTAESELARDAFRAALPRLAALLAASTSGRELSERGFGQDVALAVALDASPHAPILREGAYSAA